jgi:hypothetical protein
MGEFPDALPASGDQSTSICTSVVDAPAVGAAICTGMLRILAPSVFTADASPNPIVLVADTLTVTIWSNCKL